MFVFPFLMLKCVGTKFSGSLMSFPLLKLTLILKVSKVK